MSKAMSLIGATALLIGAGSATAGGERGLATAPASLPAAERQMSTRDPGSGTTRGATRIVVHSLRRSDGRLLHVWRPWAGAIGLSYARSSDAVVLDGNRATYWIEGRRASVIRYHFGGMWPRVRGEYGVSRAAAERALRRNATLVIKSPLRVLTADDPPRHTFTSIEDYGRNVGALAGASKTAIRYPGSAILGLQFASARIVRFANSRSNESSGPIVSLTYSSRPSALGTNDKRFVLGLTDPTTDWGQVYAGMLKRADQTITIGSVTATATSENQLDLRFGTTVGNVTTNFPMTVGDWKILLSALRRV
ncbi:MAG: hypothetical protein M3P18_19515 [Actinomycetota bacterium]|nr:hypothetical protein [Actinomycetota bacterium]